MSYKILVIDDDHLMGKSLVRCLGTEGFSCLYIDSGEEAIERLKRENYHLVLLDLSMPGFDGFETLGGIKADHPDLQVIILTASQNLQDAVRALKAGADDYLIKSSTMEEELKIAVQKAIKTSQLARENAILKKQLQQSLDQPNLLIASPGMKQVYQLIEKIAQKEQSTVLIIGESGTGKELVARKIHRLGPNSEKAFIDISCSALPTTLIESELFGFERGAFTDAKSSKQGLFELADGGTLFLDEIATLDLSLQAKLLRFLEERSFRRIGGTVDHKVEMRIIAATNRDLQKKIIANEFREDLYYRLNVFIIPIPPLRERQEDIIPLADFFIQKFNIKFNNNIKGLNDQARQLLLHYTYPGNVRELRNLIERAMIIEESDLITPASLHFPKGEAFFAEPIDFLTSQTIHTNQTTHRSSFESDQNHKKFLTLAEVEAKHIQEALLKTSGNKELAAKILGIGRSTLFRKLAERNDGP